MIIGLQVEKKEEGREIYLKIFFPPTAAKAQNYWRKKHNKILKYTQSD
jgi:hypothetical protein